jgi:Protein of unknown function (DUF3025)
MRPLVPLRRATAYDPGFVARSPLFWPIARAARLLAAFDDFPPPAALDGVFEGQPPVRFVCAAPRSRRRDKPLDVRAMYDARITLDGCVPTRARCWHDLMNALVWGTFPLAKRALHARQHRAMAERIAEGARTLPPARTREQDALALVDEGGVVVLTTDPDAVEAQLRAGTGAFRELIASGDAEAVIVGHAVYESLALGVAPAVVAALVLRRAPSAHDAVQQVDETLARAIVDERRLRTPDELCRVDIRDALAAKNASDQGLAVNRETSMTRALLGSPISRRS